MASELASAEPEPGGTAFGGRKARGSAVVVGAGPGIGTAAARRFAREGLSVALIARTAATVEKAAAEVGDTALTSTGMESGRTLPFVADAADPVSLRETLRRAVGELGTPEVVLYNAAVIRPDDIGTPIQDHLDAWAVDVGGAITTANTVLEDMAQNGRGTFLITGGMVEPDPEYLSLSLGKAAVRFLTEALHRQFGPRGVHVATVTVAGAVAPGTAYDPDDIAARYWELHRQARPDWQTHVTHG